MLQRIAHSGLLFQPSAEFTTPTWVNCPNVTGRTGASGHFTRLRVVNCPSTPRTHSEWAIRRHARHTRHTRDPAAPRMRAQPVHRATPPPPPTPAPATQPRHRKRPKPEDCNSTDRATVSSMTPNADPATTAATPVLETKLYIPRWPVGLVPRPSLTDRIREGVSGKLVVLSAPAGSGKTTLLAEWLGPNRAGTAPAGWVSLDAGDNEPATFWEYCIRALQKVEPNVGARALALLHAKVPPSVEVLTMLINDIDAIDRDFILVLDDYHVIESPAIHTGLAFFLDHLPPRMHVVIATRTDPLLPLARMRARGEVTELRASKLRFTAEETSDFFNRVMALDLSAVDVAKLETRTEGWIAGLKLAALSMKGHDNVRRFIDAFSGDNRYIADYLVEEVLQSQPEDVRRFLLHTSMLERMNGPLCDAVTGVAGSQVLLEKLEKSNLFVVALDDRREWYRYHHLFAEVLQAHAARHDRERVRELHRRASVWYEHNGSMNDAIAHAERAGDAVRVAELLECAWPAMDRSYQSGQWLARVKSLPDALVRTRPVLDMGYAWALLNAGELEAAEVHLRQVESLLSRTDSRATDPPAADASVIDAAATGAAATGARSVDATAADAAAGNAETDAMAVVDAMRYRSLPRELAMARAYHAQARGDTRGTIEHARRLLDLVPNDEHVARATAAALLALAQWAAGDLEIAYRTFADALAHMRQGGKVLDAVRGTFVLGDIRTIQGRLREADRIYQSGLQLAAENAHNGVPETDELYLGLSELHCERGDLEESERLLLSIEQSTPQASHASNRQRWCTAMARIATARGEFDRALQLLADAETHERRDPLPRVRPIAALRACIHIAQDRLVDASRWAREHRVDEHDELSYMREFEHITLARLLMARHRVEQNPACAQRAVSLLERLTTHALTGGRLGSAIETLVLRALAHHALNDTRAALDTIASALEMAEPEEYVRVFLDEGIAMRDLLRQASARGIAGAYTRRVLVAFDGPVKSVLDAKPVTAAPSSTKLLTPRELEILRLIAVGMRNQEIADQLFISPATVKRHIANVYDKLDARHRTEALRRAQMLNLL